MKILHAISHYLIRALVVFGGVFLIAMVLLTNLNIVSRLVWMPVRGTFELMGFCGAVVAAFALAHTQSKRGHIAVDVLINTFSERTRSVLQCVNNAVCLAFFILAAWQIGERAGVLRRSGEVTETLRIVYYPFTYAVGLGFAALALWFLVDLVSRLRPGEGAKR